MSSDPTQTTDAPPEELGADTADFLPPPAAPEPPPAPESPTETGEYTALPPAPDEQTVRSVTAPPPPPVVEGTFAYEAEAPVVRGTSTYEPVAAAPPAGPPGFGATADFAPGTAEPDPTRLTFDGPRFGLAKVHARGGMGEVWLARDERIGREVALKKMRARMKGKEDQFFWEGQVTGQLEHPGVAPVHELGMDDAGEPYYVMKFVHGKTLLEEIDAFHAAPAARPEREVERVRLLRVFLAVCQTVAFAHSRGILHRDIKPENVMTGEYGETLVLDWGLAKLVGEDEWHDRGPVRRLSYSGETLETVAGAIKGTPFYMSPEVAAGSTHLVDRVSDVFLLGATLYHQLTGVKPRQGKTIPELISAAHKPPPPPRSVDPTVPKPLEAVCLKAMAVERAARYQSAKELSEDLERFLAGEPVTAYRETFTERAWRWARRHRRAIGRAAAAIAVIAAAAVGVERYRKFEVQRQAERDEAARLLQEADDELKRKDAALAAEAAQNALNARMKQAAADLGRFRALAEEARFLAASTHPVAAAAPYFNARAGLAKGQEALDLAARWGAKLDAFPLDGDRPELASDLYDLLLLTAQVRAQAGGPNTGQDVLARLDRAAGLNAPGRSYHRLRAAALAATGDKAGAAAATKLADDPAARLTAADHFLLGEQARVPATRPDEMQDRTGAFKPNRAALEKAVAEYRLALRADPAHYWSHFQVGRCLMNLGQVEEGVLALGACVALRPDAPWGYNVRGLALTTLKRYDEAAADFERAARLAPDSRLVRLNRGAFLWKRGDPDAAVKDFDAALAPPAELQLPEAAFYQAQMFAELGRPDEARAAADRALAGAAPVGPAYLLRAQLHLLVGRDAEGVADLNSFFAAADPTFDPRSPAAAGRRGRRLRLIAEAFPAGATRAEQAEFTRARARVFQLARAEYQSAADRDGGTADGLEDLGRLNERLGRAADAVRAYTLALEKTGADQTADRVRRLVLRGWALQSVQPADVEKGRADFTAAVALAPDHAEAHTGLGYVEACGGAGPAARREAQLAVLHGAGDYLVLHNVACVFAKLSEAEPGRVRELEDLALDALGRGVELWKRDRTGPNALVLIRDEAAFGPVLRRRPEFRRLHEPTPD